MMTENFNNEVMWPKSISFISSLMAELVDRKWKVRNSRLADERIPN